MSKKYYTKVTVHNDKLLLSSNLGHLFLLNADTGELIWHVQIDLDDDEKSLPVRIYDDVILVGEGSGDFFAKNPKYHIRALDTNTGAQKWCIPSQNPVTNPIVHNGVVYATTGIELRAIELTSGKELWIHREKTRIGPLAIQDNVAYFLTFGSQKPRIYKTIHAFDILSQKTLWTYDGNSRWLPKFFHMETQFNNPEVNDGIVFVGALGTLFALDAYTGKNIWTREEKGFVREVQKGCIDGDTLCLRTSTHLTILDYKTQKVIETLECTPYPAIYKDSVVYYGDSAKKALIALEIDGWKQKWKRDFDSASGITLDFYNQNIALASSTDVWLLNNETGEEQWHTTLDIK